MEELQRLIEGLTELFPDDSEAPKQLLLARALQRVLNGEPPESVSAATAFSKSNLRTWSTAIREGHFYKWTRRKLPTDERLQRSRAGIAQMMLGFLAEGHFERSSRDLLQSGGFRISDDRSDASDTDYRLLDADGRPVCRLNVKFHGTLFRAAQEYVGLDPDDCFALATYKIFTALQRQKTEAVPYVFLVVTVPSLPRSFVEGHVPDRFLWLASVCGRNVEERIAQTAVRFECGLFADMPFPGELDQGQFRRPL